MEKNINTETRKHVRLRIADCGLRIYHPFSPSPLLPFFFTALCLCVSVVNLSCGSKPTDLRTVVPADSLVYLETNDLGKALRAVTDNEAFKAAAKTQPDFSALAGMKVAVVVTGFETKEQQVTEENSVLKFKPRFVAVAETNAWNYQALSFTENKLGEFINETYGGEVTLETTDKHDGKYFVWTSQDGRKAYALVRGSLIFFGNDESAIEKCFTITRGEADSLSKNPKIAASPADSLALGYVSTDGVAQIANIAGISLAMGIGEEGELKSFIARVLPEILRKSVQEISWTTVRTEQGIEDKFTIETKPEVASVFSETLVQSAEPHTDLVEFVPVNAFSATRYNLRDPQIAWRSFVLTSQKLADSLSGNLLVSFSDSLFVPYGVTKAESFLSDVRSQIVTVRFDEDGDNSIAIVKFSDSKRIRISLFSEMRRIDSVSQTYGAEFWMADDGQVSAAIVGSVLVLGSYANVEKCLIAKQSGEILTKHPLYKQFSESNAVAVTIASDDNSVAKIVKVLAELRNENENPPVYYLTETHFNKNGIERRTVSDFGLIGSIIEQLGKDN